MFPEGGMLQVTAHILNCTLEGRLNFGSASWLHSVCSHERGLESVPLSVLSVTIQDVVSVFSHSLRKEHSQIN
jgi:hypothetical protein